MGSSRGLGADRTALAVDHLHLLLVVVIARRAGSCHSWAVCRYLPDGFTAHSAAEAPSLAWNRDDALQDMLVRKAFRRQIVRPIHFVPTAEGFAAAVRSGLGWGMFPQSLAAPDLADGSFVRIS
jgi:DNA-binding transcriptional LysR family regulator